MISYLVLAITATCFLGPVVAVIGFDQVSYEIAEDIGVDNFALRVCVLADEENRSVTIATTADTATGNASLSVNLSLAKCFDVIRF